ncbi:MAG: ATPase P [Chloroflexi bacterium]|nr:ATPase P [Chloroflexota bacterium]
MLEVEVPGWRHLRLEHLVLDVNGTLTRDGGLLPGVVERIAALRDALDIRLVSADTFGRLNAIAAELAIRGQRLETGTPEAEQKRSVVHALDPDRVIAIGNGANDRGMLEEAALGIVVLGPEGLAAFGRTASDPSG